MRNEGGFATLKRLNKIVDFSLRRIKTSKVLVKRVVQYE